MASWNNARVVQQELGRQNLTAVTRQSVLRRRHSRWQSARLHLIPFLIACCFYWTTSQRILKDHLHLYCLAPICFSLFPPPSATFKRWSTPCWSFQYHWAQPEALRHGSPLAAGSPATREPVSSPTAACPHFRGRWQLHHSLAGETSRGKACWNWFLQQASLKVKAGYTSPQLLLYPQVWKLRQPKVSETLPAVDSITAFVFIQHRGRLRGAEEHELHSLPIADYEVPSNPCNSVILCDLRAKSQNKQWVTEARTGGGRKKPQEKCLVYQFFGCCFKSSDSILQFPALDLISAHWQPPSEWPCYTWCYTWRVKCQEIQNLNSIFLKQIDEKCQQEQ